MTIDAYRDFHTAGITEVYPLAQLLAGEPPQLPWAFWIGKHDLALGTCRREWPFASCRMRYADVPNYLGGKMTTKWNREAGVSWMS
ncbi:MAG: hypothetical protein H7Z40_01870 [Phycisphaerae bacterium]|nr:hypothetical protein [Gemmatimonadaceae bacterium]